MIQVFTKTFFISFIYLTFLGTFSLGFAKDTIRTYYDEESIHIKEILIKINGKAEGEVRLYDINGNLDFNRKPPK